MSFVMTASVLPPKNPPNAPSSVPHIKPKLALVKPIKNEIRKDTKSREATSRPRLSVPKICEREKNESFSDTETSFGS